MMAGGIADAEVYVACDALADRWACAQVALDVARRAGLPKARCFAAAHCASELASNAVRHAGGGVLVVRALGGAPAAVEIVCRDLGPGIDDLERARADGWSRGRALDAGDARTAGLGTGLGAVHRFAQSVLVTPGPRGVGTTVIVRLW